MKLDVKELIKELSSLDGPSGYEKAVLELIEKKIEPLVDRVWYNKVGTLIAEKKGTGSGRLGIFAHADEVGYVVTKLEKGLFARLETIGGVDPKVIFAQRVKIYTAKGIAKGIVGVLPPHLQKEEHRSKVPSFDKIFVDLSCSELGEYVSVGDICVVDVKPVELNGKLCGKAMDNRAGCASLILAAQLLRNIRNYQDVYFVFSSQEEVTGLGAVSIAYELRLDRAIVVDVTHGDVKIPQFVQIKTGEGPALCVGPVIDKEFYSKLYQTAQRNNVKIQIEPAPGRSGTDTDEVQLSGTGVRTTLVSIPLMYMHTPVEVVDPRDVEETARLLALATTIE
ncbi:MAG TPA: M20/M25/M40 family metallo-hydrolase [Pseudothermotoga sp.]|nr:M20/M25/M40 family metallo-hydrolase [Pseudothermotoga sp.]HOK83409.1 M20/M25/M40 family metallo-hydrolase [Pseudothermotoga sp.]HPP69482.1 M20/M25/M40 family metallo-hydrolase [Pseudothermotoga sp.]